MRRFLFKIIFPNGFQKMSDEVILPPDRGPGPCIPPSVVSGTDSPLLPSLGTSEPRAADLVRGELGSDGKALQSRTKAALLANIVELLSFLDEALSFLT